MSLNFEFIYNSGFLLQTEHRQALIDYYQGPVRLHPEKPCLLVASHGHSDHFSPKIFELYRPGDHYLLSAGIPLIGAGRGKPANRLTPGSQGTLPDSDTDRAGAEVAWRCFDSTDEGVSVLLQLDGQSIFHAGDLNLWIWEDNSADYDAWMRAAFQAALDDLAGYLAETAAPLDLAFFPVDARLGDRYLAGAAAFIEQIRPRCFFPMHFQNQWPILDRFRREAQGLSAVRSGATKLLIPSRWNESFSL